MKCAVLLFLAFVVSLKREGDDTYKSTVPAKRARHDIIPFSIESVEEVTTLKNPEASSSDLPENIVDLLVLEQLNCARSLENLPKDIICLILNKCISFQARAALRCVCTELQDANFSDTLAYQKLYLGFKCQSTKACRHCRNISADGNGCKTFENS